MVVFRTDEENQDEALHKPEFVLLSRNLPQRTTEASRQRQRREEQERVAKERRLAAGEYTDVASDLKELTTYHAKGSQSTSNTSVLLPRAISAPDTLPSYPSRPTDRPSNFATDTRKLSSLSIGFRSSFTSYPSASALRNQASYPSTSGSFLTQLGDFYAGTQQLSKSYGPSQLTQSKSQSLLANKAKENQDWALRASMPDLHSDKLSVQDKDGEENRQGSLCYLCDTEEAAHRLRISFHDAMQLKESQENNRNSTLRATRKSAVPPLKLPSSGYREPFISQDPTVSSTQRREQMRAHVLSMLYAKSDMQFEQDITSRPQPRQNHSLQQTQHHTHIAKPVTKKYVSRVQDAGRERLGLLERLTGTKSQDHDPLNIEKEYSALLRKIAMRPQSITCSYIGGDHQGT